jgi:hypothetical protein
MVEASLTRLSKAPAPNLGRTPSVPFLVEGALSDRFGALRMQFQVFGSRPARIEGGQGLGADAPKTEITQLIAAARARTPTVAHRLREIEGRSARGLPLEYVPRYHLQVPP